MKEFLTYIPYSLEKNQKEQQFVYNDGIYLLGFKKTYYQNMEFQIYVDGEVYNEEEVLFEFQKAHFPEAGTIEELFLYAYLLWGVELYHYLEGAYAFTIQKGSTIITIKDPLGLKPVFYLESAQGIYLSNRIETIFQFSKQQPILNKQGILELFSFGPGLSENETLFKDLKALPMGSMLSIRNHKITVTTYYELPLKAHHDTLEETIEKVHELVSDSVRRQSRDCNASFLSGGLDSSIITSICARLHPQWRTYALDYEGNAENFKENLFQVSLDQEFIDDMLTYCNCEHRKCTITQEELVNKLTEAMIARNMPGMGDVDSSLLWLCEQVSQKEKIILSGECSDELFGGYPWFYREEFKELDTFPWLRYREQRSALLNAKIKDLDYQGYVEKRYNASISKVNFLKSDSEEDKRSRIQTQLVLHWFMQTLITRQVCEGNQANVNIRAPFANVKLLEYVYNIPWSLKFYGDEEKGILRKAFEKELPESVAHRKKNPFPKTHNPKYAKLISDKLRERFQDPKSPLHILFDDEKLLELMDSEGSSYTLPWYGQLMSGPQLLAYIYQIDAWIRHYNIQIDLS